MNWPHKKNWDELMKTVPPYVSRSKAHARNKQQHGQGAPPTPVPSLDDVQPFMSVPDFVEKLGSELEALLTSQHIRNPCPYPGNIRVLPSYRAEPIDSAYSKGLTDLAKHAIAQAWKYDPLRCSVKDAIKLAQDRTGKLHHGLVKEEYNWTTGQETQTVKNVRGSAQVDVWQARKTHQWTKKVDKDDKVHNVEGIDLDRELDHFYGSNGTDLRPIDDESDEGFSEPSSITTTVVSLPDKSLMEAGITPGGIFQDSGISMDEGYAAYSLAHSLPSTAKETTGKIPSDWPRFNADVAPLRTPKENGPRLGLIGDQKQYKWPGRRQGPYDLDGLRSPDKNETADGPISGPTHGDPPPAEVNESVPLAQKASEPVREIVNNERSRIVPQSFGQEQTSLHHGNNGSSFTIKDVEHSQASVGAAYSASEERLRYSRGSIGGEADNGSSVIASHVIFDGPQTDNYASTHVHHSVSKTPFSTPVNQRTSLIQQVQVDNAATPETINIHLTPTYDVKDDASDGSLEARIPHSPTTDTQKGQSALGRYVEETKSHPIPAHQTSSTVSTEDSESEDPLILSQTTPSQPKNRAVFNKDVELHQKKNHPLLTLSPRKEAQGSQSPSKQALIPMTPPHAKNPASFRPITPFQLRTPAHADFASPATPTPAPKGSKAKGKSVIDIFKSPQLGTRSPERANPNSNSNSQILVAPIAPTAGASDPHRGSPFGGSQGLLFQKTKTNERSTKNVLNSLKLSPARGGSGSGGALSYDGLHNDDDGDDYEDELAGGNDFETYKPSPMRSSAVNAVPRKGGGGGENGAQAVVTVPRVRSRDDDDDGNKNEGVQQQGGELRRSKRPRRSVRSADVVGSSSSSSFLGKR